jgi:hypothetical protein
MRFTHEGMPVKSMVAPDVDVVAVPGVMTLEPIADTTAPVIVGLAMVVASVDAPVIVPVPLIVIVMVNL